LKILIIVQDTVGCGVRSKITKFW